MTDDPFESAELEDAESPPASRGVLPDGTPIPENADLDENGNVQYTPTGRIKRKYGARKNRTDVGGTKTSGSKNAKLAEQLCDPIAKLATGLAFTMPTAAAVLIARGERTADALVAIAADHPRMLAALNKVAKVGPASDIAETLVMLFIAVNLDLGKLPPEHPIAVVTGVGKLYEQTHPKTAEQTFNIPPPPDAPFKEPPGRVFPLSDPRHPMYSFRAGAHS